MAFGRGQRRNITGGSMIQKKDDRDDLNNPNLPPCHARNGGHDVKEVSRHDLGNGKTSVKGCCTKCGVTTSELLNA